MAQPPTGSAPSATQNSSSAPIPVPNTTTAQPINVPSSSTQSMAPAPISSSPPRSIISLRKASLVERTSAAIEAKLSSAGVPLRRGSSSATAQFSQILSQDGDQYPMHPDAYELGPAIGYGSSATVYIAKCLPMNKHVAIKMIDLDMFERNQIDELRREIQIMSLSKHPNLLPVHGSFVSGSKLYIVTPFLSAGSCLDIMKTAHPEGLEEVTVSTILKQALQGLEYLHKNGLIHRDVKAGNLLMDDDGLVQLADFGVSSSLDTGERRGMRKTFVGTPCWMAPEVMEQSGYDFKADIWSFGITALELATGHAPFAKYPPIKVLMLTLQNDPPTLDRDTTKHRYSKGFKEMIDTCLQKDPSKRPTAEKLLQHPFFKQAKKNQYLVQVLLKGLPSITSRPHNRRSTPSKKQEKQGVSWDFTDPKDETDGTSKPADEGQKAAETTEPREQPQAQAPQKKSRFIVDTTPSSTSAQSSSPPTSQSNSQPPSAVSVQFQEPNGAGKPTAPAVQALASGGEVKKGRFSVVEAISTSVSSNEGQKLSAQSGPASGSVEGYTSDATSVPSLERNKGRFVSIPTSTASPTDMAFSATSVSSQGSNAPQKLGRFVVSSESANMAPATGNTTVVPGGQGFTGSRGRFQVTTGENHGGYASSGSGDSTSCSPNASPSNSLSRGGSVPGSLNNGNTASGANASTRFVVTAAAGSVSLESTQSSPTVNLDGSFTDEPGVLQEKLTAIAKQYEEQRGDLLDQVDKLGLSLPAGFPHSVFQSDKGNLTLEQQLHALIRDNELLKRDNEQLRSVLSQHQTVAGITETNSLTILKRQVEVLVQENSVLRKRLSPPVATTPTTTVAGENGAQPVEEPSLSQQLEIELGEVLKKRIASLAQENENLRKEVDRP